MSHFNLKCLKLFHFSLAAAWIFSSSIAAQTFQGPSHVEELGYLISQRANQIEGEVVWADYDALRRDFEFLKGLSDRQLDSLIVANFSVITNAQLALVGVLISNSFGNSTESRMIYHPRSYIRGGVAGFRSNDPRQVFGLGAVDLKGTGMSPEGEVRLLRNMLRKMIVEEGIALKDIDNSIAKQWIEAYENHKKERDELLAELQAADTTVQRKNRIRHGLSVLKGQIRLHELMLELSDKVAKKELDPKVASEKYLEHMRGMDYINGMMPLSRAFKEVVVQKATQKLFDEYNQKNGTNYRTIDNYFLIATKTEIHGQRGKRQLAGILGRQAHWRDHKFDEAETRSYPSEIMAPVLSGAGQADVFRSVVDFELPEIIDPRVHAYLGWDVARGQQIEKHAEEAEKLYVAGSKDGFKHLFNLVMRPLDDIKTSGVKKPSHDKNQAEFDLAMENLEKGIARHEDIAERLGRLNVKNDEDFEDFQNLSYLALASSREPDVVSNFWLERIKDQESKRFFALVDTLSIFSVRHPKHFVKLVRQIVVRADGDDGSDELLQSIVGSVLFEKLRSLIAERYGLFTFGFSDHESERGFFKPLVVAMTAAFILDHQEKVGKINVPEGIDRVNLSVNGLDLKEALTLISEGFSIPFAGMTETLAQFVDGLGNLLQKNLNVDEFGRPLSAKDQACGLSFIDEA